MGQPDDLEPASEALGEPLLYKERCRAKNEELEG
jgi:hypothetical protein